MLLAASLCFLFFFFSWRQQPLCYLQYLQSYVVTTFQFHRMTIGSPTSKISPNQQQNTPKLNTVPSALCLSTTPISFPYETPSSSSHHIYLYVNMDIIEKQKLCFRIRNMCTQPFLEGAFLQLNHVSCYVQIYSCIPQFDAAHEQVLFWPESKSTKLRTKDYRNQIPQRC